MKTLELLQLLEGNRPKSERDDFLGARDKPEKDPFSTHRVAKPKKMTPDAFKEVGTVLFYKLKNSMESRLVNLPYSRSRPKFISMSPGWEENIPKFDLSIRIPLKNDNKSDKDKELLQKEFDKIIKTKNIMGFEFQDLTFKIGKPEPEKEESSIGKYDMIYYPMSVTGTVVKVGKFRP